MLSKMIFYISTYINNLPIDWDFARTFIILEILKICHRSVSNSIP